MSPSGMMEGNSGLPPEIIVLCTTVETKERAVRLLEWIQGIPEIQTGLARDPAIPAVCSLIASEQLGNTVVTERRAQHWSQTTPERFRTIKKDVHTLIMTSRTHDHTKKRILTFKTLVDEFCQENVLPHMLKVEEGFRKAPGNERWRTDSDTVQAAIFFWTCRWFKIPTSKSIESIRRDYNFSPTDLKDLQDFLDVCCASIRPRSSKAPQISAAASSSRLIISPSETPAVTPPESATTGTNLLTLGELANEFGVGEDALGGMRFLDETVREQDDFKDLVDWDSTMGRCVVFYWTCSVLKIPSAKHITLRNQFNLSKREFDRLLSALDLHRADLRKKLEEFYAGNPALQLLPQGTQWPATSPANLKHHIPSASGLIEKSASPSRKIIKKGTGRRGRPPKPKSPPPISTEPTTTQEEALLPLCRGPTLDRALILLRSFNIRRLPASEADRVPPKALPALVALLASQQLEDGQLDATRASKSSGLQLEEFNDTLATVRSLIHNFHSFEEFARQTAFDSLALEHGMSIDAIISMLHVREFLKDSRCLSVGMDWDSPLVICSVFFWTCAILKVPEVKQSLLRSRSLTSKREFDSMLQLLNSHCTVIRHQLEDDSAASTFWFAPPPSTSRPSSLGSGRRHPSFYGEQEIYLDEQDARASKRMKREMNTPSEYDLELSDGKSSRAARKPGRPPKARRPAKRDEPSASGNTAGPGVQDPIYRPTTQFPPADWIPPEPLSSSTAGDSISACPPSESGGSKRGHTRYKTRDYEHTMHERFSAWKPEGEDIAKQLATYQHRVEKMERMYGPSWEKRVTHVNEGVPFE